MGVFNPNSTPGGSDTQVQFNDGGVFGGSSKLTFSKTSGVLTFDDGFSNTGSITIANGGLLLSMQTSGPILLGGDNTTYTGIYNTSGNSAFLDSSLLTADRIFTFPDEAGQIVTGIGSGSRVTFWNTSSALSSDSAFTWEEASNSLSIGPDQFYSCKLQVSGAIGYDGTGNPQGAFIISDFINSAASPALNMGITVDDSWIQSRFEGSGSNKYPLLLNPEGGVLRMGSRDSSVSGAKLGIYQNIGSTSTPSGATNTNIGNLGTNYFTGDILKYRITAYKTFLGIKSFSTTYSETSSQAAINDGDAFQVDWTDNTSGGSDGFIIQRDLNSDGFAYYYDTTTSSVSLIDDDPNSFVWISGAPTLTPTSLGNTYYNYNNGTNFWGTYGGSGYFEGKVGIGTNSPSYPLVVIQPDSTAATGSVFKGYSDGGTINKSIVQIQNSYGQKVIDFSSSNLYPADDGNLNLIGYATSSYDQYSLGVVNFINNSSEASGDKRIGGLFMIRDGAWNNTKFQLLTRDPSAGFQYALVLQGDSAGISGVSSPTARLHLPASSTASGTAAIKFTSGSIMTTPEAGAMEFNGSFFYFTPVATRKQIVLTQTGIPANGAIPIGDGFYHTNATITGTANQVIVTNGAGSITLSLPQSIATTSTPQFAGIGIGTASAASGITLADANNIVVQTTTGTKIGTSTSQKLGFFNATPVVQQGATTEIGTVLSNLGLRASGTAYPITTSGAITFGSLTSGRIPYAGTAGLLSDESAFQWDAINDRLLIGASVSSAYSITFGPSSDQVISINDLLGAGTGRTLTLRAGAAQSGQSNTAGGDLVLSAGVSTGNASTHKISFQSGFANGSGTSQNSPSEKAKMSAAGDWTFAASARSTGSPTLFTLTAPAHTTLTTGTEAIDVNFNLARTNQFAGGNITTQRAFLIQAPTYSFSSGPSTVTNAATFAISGAPVAGSGAVLTNSHALWVQGGNAQFDGGIKTNNITNSALTSGRVTFAGASGLLSDDADMTFSADTLTVTKLTASTSANISTLSNLTTNGFVKTSGGVGTLSVDTATYTPTSTTISTVAPLSGGGDLSANRTITTSMATNKLIGRGTAGTGVMEEITLGTNLSFTGTTLNATGSTITEAEIDFGSTPTPGKKFTITDAGITATKKIMVSPSGSVATGRVGNDWEWDMVDFAALAGTGSFTLTAKVVLGRIIGKRKIFYTYA